MRTDPYLQTLLSIEMSSLHRIKSEMFGKSHITVSKGDARSSAGSSYVMCMDLYNDIKGPFKPSASVNALQ